MTLIRSPLNDQLGPYKARVDWACRLPTDTCLVRCGVCSAGWPLLRDGCAGCLPFHLFRKQGWKPFVSASNGWPHTVTVLVQTVLTLPHELRHNLKAPPLSVLQASWTRSQRESASSRAPWGSFTSKLWLPQVTVGSLGLFPSPLGFLPGEFSKKLLNANCRVWQFFPGTGLQQLLTCHRIYPFMSLLLIFSFFPGEGETHEGRNFCLLSPRCHPAS